MAKTTLSVDRSVNQGSNKIAVAGFRSTARSTGHKQRATPLQSASRPVDRRASVDRPVDRETCTRIRTKTARISVDWVGRPI